MNKLFEFLSQHGGAIISSNDLHPDLIAQARAANRMHVDEYGYGYAWEPPFAGRFPETPEEVEMFEWCYPLPVEVPKEWKSPDWVNKNILSKVPSPMNTEKIKTFEGHLNTSSKRLGFYDGWGNSIINQLPKTFKAFREAAEAYAQQRYEQGLKADRWVSVSDRLPEKDSSVLCIVGKQVLTCFYAREKQVEVGYDEDYSMGSFLADEESGQCYLNPGWYEECEQVENSSGYDSIYLSRKVTHWQPLPPLPEAQPLTEK